MKNEVRREKQKTEEEDKKMVFEMGHTPLCFAATPWISCDTAGLFSSSLKRVFLCAPLFSASVPLHDFFSL